MQLGAGMVTLGPALVFSLRKLNARPTELGRQAILPVTLNSENPWVMPDSSRHLSFAEPVRSASKPFQPMMSSSHQLRLRNSPSVHASSPTRSCMAMTSRMHSSHHAQLRVVVRADGAGRRLRAEKLFARPLEFFWAQQAADLVGAKRRIHRPRRVASGSRQRHLL